jgi:hypothetical protein
MLFAGFNADWYVIAQRHADNQRRRSWTHNHIVDRPDVSTCPIRTMKLISSARMGRSRLQFSRLHAESALRGGLNERDALAKALSAAFWFCGACAASGQYTRSRPKFSMTDAAGALVILFGMRGWQMLSEMKQGGESRKEAGDLPVAPRSDDQLERTRG